jgi:hypothetical protein
MGTGQRIQLVFFLEITLSPAGLAAMGKEKLRKSALKPLERLSRVNLCAGYPALRFVVRGHFLVRQPQLPVLIMNQQNAWREDRQPVVHT